MWEFYLIASEIGFRYGKQMVFQMQLARRLDTLPITRDYVAEAEADFASRETAPVTRDSARAGGP
ncbi:MAG: SAM-dependent methyltransferase, partial [Kiloniellales bacterium]